MIKSIKYSIVVPAYSEAMVIENSLQKLAQELKKDKKRFDTTEVIVVVADSSDNTAKLAKEKFQSI